MKPCSKYTFMLYNYVIVVWYQEIQYKLKTAKITIPKKQVTKVIWEIYDLKLRRRGLK